MASIKFTFTDFLIKLYHRLSGSTRTGTAAFAAVPANLFMRNYISFSASSNLPFSSSMTASLVSRGSFSSTAGGQLALYS